MTTLIVGCGYLGQRVASRLIARGDRVIGTVRSAERARQVAALGVEPIVADVLDAPSLKSLPAADRILYCVGYDRRSGQDRRAVAIDGLGCLLEIVDLPSTRFVLASSTAVYGQTGGERVDEGSPTEPIEVSGAIVLEAEKLLDRWAAEQGVSRVILRFSGLYGPGRVIGRAALEKGLPISGDPGGFLNLVHIDDAARAAGSALFHEKPEPLYVVSDNRPVRREEYYRVVARCLNLPGPTFRVPEPSGPSRQVSNRRMHDGLLVSLLYPDITSGVPAAIAGD